MGEPTTPNGAPATATPDAISRAARDVQSLQRLRGLILTVALALLPLGSTLIATNQVAPGVIVIACGLLASVVYVYLAPETYYFRLGDRS